MCRGCQMVRRALAAFFIFSIVINKHHLELWSGTCDIGRWSGELGSPGSDFRCDLEPAHRLIIFHGEVKGEVGDGAIQPAVDTPGCLGPSSIDGSGWSLVDVPHEAKLAEHGLEEGAPLAVVGGTEFQSHGDLRLDAMVA